MTREQAGRCGVCGVFTYAPCYQARKVCGSCDDWSRVGFMRRHWSPIGEKTSVTLYEQIDIKAFERLLEQDLWKQTQEARESGGQE